VLAAQVALTGMGLSMSALLGPVGLISVALGTGAILYGQYATAKAEATRLTDAMADALSREAGPSRDLRRLHR
jgi:Cu/Ag efflux pump CusA